MQTENLWRIDGRRLIVGRPLPAALRDRKGNVVLRAGHVLTARDITRFTKDDDLVAYIGEDWPEAARQPPPAPRNARNVLADPRPRRPRKKTRQHKRHPYVTPLDLVIEERSPAGCRQRQVRVMARDLSASGFSFAYQQFIHAGTVVRVKFEALPGRAHLIAIVRHCTHVSGREHRVGVEFAGTTPPDSAKPH